MRVSKRFIQGVGKKGGEFEGYQILNDESDGTFYPIKDSEHNVAYLCKKLNRLAKLDVKKCCETCFNWQWDWFDDGDEFQTCVDYDHCPQRFPEYPGDIYIEWDCPFWEEID